MAELYCEDKQAYLRAVDVLVHLGQRVDSLADWIAENELVVKTFRGRTYISVLSAVKVCVGAGKDEKETLRWINQEYDLNPNAVKLFRPSLVRLGHCFRCGGSMVGNGCISCSWGN